MIGVMSPDEIDAALARNNLGRIACSAHDRPYVVPISYVYDGEFIYAYGTAGRKIEAMREQPHVCFEVDDIASANTWWSVVSEGAYEELIDESGRSEALRLLGLDQPNLDSRVVSPVWGVVLFRIRLIQKSGRFELRAA